MSCNVISTLPLDSEEKLFCAHGSWVTVAHAAHLTGSASTLISNAPHAIQCLLKRYSRMRTRLRMYDDHYAIDFFKYDPECMPSELFFSVVEIIDASWQQVVEERCNTDPYSDDGTRIFPLFHFMLLVNSLQPKDERFHLVLFANHCVTDGRSGFILINDFLTLASNQNIRLVDEPLSNEFLPLMNELISRPTGFVTALKTFAIRQLMKRQSRPVRQPPPRIPVKAILHFECKSSKFNMQRYRNKFLFASSGVNLYANLHQQCRSNQVTLHGPLFACLLLALHHCFPDKDDTGLTPFQVGVAYDMRSRLPQSVLTPSSVGCFIFGNAVTLSRSLPIESTRFWSLAHQCMSSTRKQVMLKRVSSAMHYLHEMLEHDRDLHRFAQSVYEGREAELAFSNVGKYPFPCDYTQGQVRLRGLHVVNNASLYRVSTTVYVTCAGDGQLDFSLAHDMDGDKKAQEFLDYYVRLIETCAKQECCNAEVTLDQLLRAVGSR